MHLIQIGREWGVDIQPPVVLGLLGLALLTYALSLAIYRLVFHPLARFPGPKVAAATRLYEAYFDVIRGGKYIFKIADLHKQYGPIVRISPYELHVNDPSFHKTLYSHIGRWDKYEFPCKAFQTPRAGFATIDHYEHKKRRAALNPFFSKQKIAGLEPALRQQIEILADRIERNVASGEILELGVAFSALAMDILTEYAMERSMGNLRREDYNKSMVNFFTGFGPVWIVGKHLPLLPWIFNRLPSWVISNTNDELAAYKAFSENNWALVRRVMSERDSDVIEAKGHKTVFHELLKADDLPLTANTEEDLLHEGDVIISGGTETMSHALQVIAYHLCADTAILQRLREELDHVQPLGSTEPASLQELEKLPYMTAVLTEGLRLSYGAVTRLARVAPDRAILYKDWVIPPGTPVGMSNGLLFHDEEYFPDSHSFIPERWLDPEEKKRLDNVFAPFGRGTRMCLGMNLAWAELYLTISTLFSRFDFRLYETTIEDVQFGSDAFLGMMKSPNKVRVIAEKRKAL